MDRRLSSYTGCLLGLAAGDAMGYAVDNKTLEQIRTQYGPEVTCTRGQVVTFLYRTVGEPEVTETKHSFTDVSSTAFYYKAMLWAVENKVTSGTSATTFEPESTCTRGQVVTFLYRAVTQ